MPPQVLRPRNEKNSPLSVDEWSPAFHIRSSSSDDHAHGWCAGSLNPKDIDDNTCPLCGCDTAVVPRREGVARNLYRVHLRSPHQKGLYFIHLGAVHGEGDWCKIGSSEKMVDRLFTHLRDRRHEKAEVLHIIGRTTNWKITEGVEGLIVGRLRDEFPEARLYEEYFPYSEKLLSRVIELMDSPELLIKDLLDD